ncbi:phosphatidylcholine:diacylglycerol cholinephosphotransferase 1 isoform X3 [Physcomitrium patens]|uniref:AtPDCT1/2 transmembrane domain-containing protein n=1 Tax=Physcomitrium patens TaxID=3218 RepID=A0A7I4EA29_PHYPA|nr:phosphatidylcholine:diacylglycerol cholinephosphotransferase 1-like isoform X3 [Physcomitrium patens]|eukprot:XP_024382278.1 phosphatidylcholine:diacylglycerol cholinephosphotransferase 1-like isoform X3 [Physcomitrella patens]
MDTSKKWSKGNKRISPVFLRWRPAEAWHIVRAHPWLMFLFINFALVIPLEYNISMIEPRGEPYDAGFVITKRIHNILELRPTLNHVLAAANTALVVFQIVYIAWAWVVEGRFRPVLASAFMFSSRGILGYSTQLPVPQEFLGSGVDFPVGHVSFFLFFSGHVGASIIATLDLRCVNRGGLVTTWLACAKRGSRPSLPVSQGFLIILI